MLSWDHTPSLEPMRCCRAWVEINLAALRHNVRQFRGLLPATTQLMAVVKADAYGHGAVAVAQTALQSGATWLGVATVPEGIELRAAGVQAPILVMGAVNSTEEMQAIAHWRLQPTLVNPKQALVFSDTLSGLVAARPLGVHLKIDTGMSRLGFPWAEAVDFARFVRQLPHLKIDSLYSHLATADSPDPTVMQQQQQRFRAALGHLQQQQLLPPRLHLANTAATLADPALHYDLVRVGLGLYGLYPAPHLRSRLDLQPVMQVKARITHLKDVPAGTGISYGHQYVCDRPLRLAVVGIGYADGVPRVLSNQLQVMVKGCLAQQIGAITMDQLMLDVSNIPNLQEGDVVTLLGRDGHHTIGPDDWAALANTISWEILCGFKHRLPRIAVEQSLVASTAIQS
ncbi:alanine racemase [Phormidium tenue]|uniref:Alanine racemase n=1 Tax=Phormidium tenue NIES-30 TaxID=549789 RepID=A0A1U7JA44_9CYAN|nr:alanine racemase [Phormidium tenue]MBD2230694.1 alanine racemase [Phormidium tenue FACHB-1052]OKH50549.1 alanine racemase [Phormidium tenue NIES-30]